MSFITINNQQSVPVNTIPELEYNMFYDINISLIEDHPERHCVLYFGYRETKMIRLMCCIADDIQHNIMVSSSIVSSEAVLNSFLQKTCRSKDLSAKYMKTSALIIQIIHG